MPRKNDNLITLDATNKSFGRLASQIAYYLLDKDIPKFKYNVKSKRKINIINIGKLRLSDNKLSKKYFHYSGYLGGMKTTTLQTLFQKNPSDFLKKVVLHMLPKNKTRKELVKRLIIS